MKRILIFLIIIVTCLTTVILARVFISEKGQNSEEIITEQYYSTSGNEAKIFGEKMAVYDGDIKIIDLNTKTIIKTIEIPGKIVLGFDLYEDKLLWSDLRNEPNEDKKKGLMETANSDIFMYDISQDTLSQITTDGAAQTRPTVWGNHIAWQDNRNDELVDGFPQWNIYLYEIDKKSEKRITNVQGVHTDCQLSENILVWEDGRNFSGLQRIRLDSDMPINNTDIYMYIIDQDRYLSIAHSVYRDSAADIWKDYVVWESREDLKQNANIMLYNIKTMETKYITSDEYSQKKPAASEEVLVWVDERNGTESFNGIQKDRNGKSDLGICDLKTGKEFILEEEGAQTLCSVTPSYIVYSSRLNSETSEIKVIKYHRNNNGEALK